jgi:RyR domain
MLSDEDIAAMLCHEANRAICEAAADYSQLRWEDAPDWQRESALKGVLFHIENPDASPSASHESWMREKVATGWIYGETKDADAKTHPCMAPYDQLPLEQRVKDHVFRAVVHAYMASRQ